jgi:LmbE family N-acetylglucosaminyl deacetylase
VDISATIERKIAALEQHASQDRPDPLDAFVRERARRCGEAIGLSYAEAFLYLVMR